MPPIGRATKPAPNTARPGEEGCGGVVRRKELRREVVVLDESSGETRGRNLACEGRDLLLWLAGAVSLASLVLAWRFVPESPIRASGRFDILGTVGLSSALISLLLGSQGALWDCTSGRTVGASAGESARFGQAHGATDQRVDDLGRDRAVHQFRADRPAAAGAHQHGSRARVSTLVAGLCMAPSGIGMLIFAPVSARISAARGAQLTLLLGCVVLAVTNLLQALLIVSIPMIIAVVTCTAAGTTLAYPAMLTVIMAETPETETAAANSLNTVMRTIGTSTCSAGTGALLVTFTMDAGGQVLPAGTAYTVAFVISAACAAAALLAAVLVVMRRRRISRAAADPFTEVALSIN